MQPLELTKQKAEDLNKLCSFALQDGPQRDGFDIGYYAKQNPEYRKDYLKHLVAVAKQYDQTKILELDTLGISATYNTSEFLKSGGYLGIYEKEQSKMKKERIDLRNAERVFKTYWWTFGFAVAAFLISLVLSILKLKEYKCVAFYMSVCEQFCKLQFLFFIFSPFALSHA